jgi:translation initiation factor IF-2
VNFRIIRSAVGEISLQDLELAKQSNARVVGFNVSVSQHGKKFLKDHPQIKVNTSKLIYELLDPLCVCLIFLLSSKYLLFIARVS